MLNKKNLCNLKKWQFKTIIMVVVVITIIAIFSSSSPKKIDAITLKELSNEISKLSSDEENLIEEIVATESLIEIKKNQIAELIETIKRIGDELNELGAERKNLEKKLSIKKDELRDRIVYSYKYGNDNVIKMMVSARDINEFITSLYILKNIMKRDAELITEIRLDKEVYDRILRKSEEKKKQLEATRKDQQNEQKKLEAALQKGNALLEKVKGEKSSVQKTLADIRARIAEIQPQGITLAGEWKVVATAYYAGGGGLNGDGVTATGLRARKGIVAVDPRLIPLGTKLYIEGYGQALAADTGGWIKGDRIDLCFDTLEEAYRYGRRKIYIYLVEN
ncbi:MAG: 3D domain-containing protein [Actinobacteria bacterium]|nr:3D domain-containing protein [Actinomycetota bacterium]